MSSAALRAYKNINPPVLWLGIALCAAAALKFFLAQGDTIPFNSDEAVVGLMARHILEGERPVFFYGQAYMGSLDAILVAAGFYLLGEQVWVIRLVQSLLYLGVLLSAYSLGKVVFNSWKVGALAACLLAVPAVNVALYTTASLGGYGEALLIGNLIMLSGLRIADRLESHGAKSLSLDWLFLGFLCGLGVWAFGLTLVFAVPTGLYLLFHIDKHFRRTRAAPVPGMNETGGVPGIGAAGLVVVFLAFTIGFAAGSAPVWSFAAQHGADQLIEELGGGAISGVEGLSWLGQVLQHTVNLVLFGSTVVFGLRPPWGIVWLGLPLLPFVLLFWMAVLVHMARFFTSLEADREKAWLLLGLTLTVLLGFILTPFGADPSGRYFLPLTVPLTLFAAHFILQLEPKFGKPVFGLAGLLVAFNLWGITQCAMSPQAISTQFYAPARIDHHYDSALIEFLLEHGETRGYSNYWVSYPVAFLSGEQVIFIPRLPYHPDLRFTLRDDRYAPYSIQVEQSSRIAYITTRQAELDAEIRAGLQQQGVSWSEEQIGDFNVYYDLSHPVLPDELGLPLED